MAQILQQILIAFGVGGAICLIGQILLDIAKLTPAHAMSLLVVSGSILGGLGLYQPFADWAGMGAGLPIISFGNQLALGALEGAQNQGFWGIWLGLLSNVSAGIALTVFWGITLALFCKPKG